MQQAVNDYVDLLTKQSTRKDAPTCAIEKIEVSQLQYSKGAPGYVYDTQVGVVVRYSPNLFYKSIVNPYPKITIDLPPLIDTKGQQHSIASDAGFLTGDTFLLPTTRNNKEMSLYGIRYRFDISSISPKAGVLKFQTSIKVDDKVMPIAVVVKDK